MPEGAEIKVLGDQVRPIVLNQTIIAVSCDPQKHFVSLEKSIPLLLNKTIKDVFVHGKHMQWELDDGHCINFSFGMSGSFSIQPTAYDRIVFSFKSKQEIAYTDIRCFGNITVNTFSTAPLGIDPFSPLYNFNDFKIFIKLKPKRRLAEVLLDQNCISGIGNYLRAEILYKSKLSPWRAVESLSEQELKNLFSDIYTVMVESYQCGGATLATYKSLNGTVGTFVDKLKVYKKKKDPDGNDVVRELDKTKRAMWWVPAVQK